MDSETRPGPDRLDEKALRRPGCSGVTIELADGQGWVVRRPRVLWVADDTEDGFAIEYDLGPEYAALWKAVEQAADRRAEIKAEIAVAKYLLRLNYDLDARAIGRLLRLDFTPVPQGAEPTPGQRIVQDIEDLIFGRVDAPKA